MNRKKIIFMDSGDTIVDEATEKRNEEGLVIHADLIPGAGEMLRSLYEEGYIVAMVADGEEQSFRNIYEENGLAHCFTTRTISEIVGVQKPAKEMFQDAMRKNSLSDDDKKRILMVGNNLKKDIVGANRFGIISVLLDWSPRYNMIPNKEEEQPDYVIHQPQELLELVKKLDT